MDILKKAEKFAKEKYKLNDPPHQWDHIRNIMKRALEIAKNFIEVDYEALKLAVIFHDIDYRIYEKHVENSIKIAKKFLKDNKYSKEKIEKVAEIMLNHSTPHRKEFGEAKLLEGKIIYDADKSIYITTKGLYKKYYPKLYLKETKRLVKKF